MQIKIGGDSDDGTEVVSVRFGSDDMGERGQVSDLSQSKLERVDVQGRDHPKFVFEIVQEAGPIGRTRSAFTIVFLQHCFQCVGLVALDFQITVDIIVFIVVSIIVITVGDVIVHLSSNLDEGRNIGSFVEELEDRHFWRTL
jgi:hypothetical protein